MSDDKIIEESAQGTATMLPGQQNNTENQKKVYIETYGCHMNFSDSEIVASILAKENYVTTDNEYVHAGAGSLSCECSDDIIRFDSLYA